MKSPEFPIRTVDFPVEGVTPDEMEKVIEEATKEALRQLTNQSVVPVQLGTAPSAEESPPPAGRGQYLL